MIQDAKYCQAINIGVLVSFSYLYQKDFIVGAMDGYLPSCHTLVCIFFDNTAIVHILFLFSIRYFLFS
jgi:hypothetical protein